MKKMISLLLALVLVLGVATNALAAGNVTYDGSAKEFIFAPGSSDSPTDLFSDFKDVMPGDSITQLIFVRNDSDNGVKIKVYMRSLGAQEDTDEFLSQMNLTVEQAGDSILFDAPSHETAQLTDWVYIGTVYSGGEITLDVTLDVPVTLDNNFQEKIGYIDWQFKVEELPVEPEDPKPPQTGDTTNLALYSGLMVCSLAAVIVLLAVGKRRKQEV